LQRASEEGALSVEQTLAELRAENAWLA